MISPKDSYHLRFSEKERIEKNIIWKELCKHFFQRYVYNDDTIIDIGAGYCEFINNISAKRKIAVDLNPDTGRYARKNVEVLQSSAFAIPKIYDGKMDIVFMSNFLEHLNSKEDVFSLLKRAHQLLRNQGRIIILQPNISLVKERYWDFFDHKVPLNDRSLKEALTLANFCQIKVIKRFLPYSTKCCVLPNHSFILSLYLSIPPWIRPLAGQSFFVGLRA